MNIEKEIRNIVEEGMRLPYRFGSYYRLNILLDELKTESSYPVCVHLQHTEGEMQMSDGAYYQTARDTEQVMVGFADAIPLDYSNDKLIDQVDALKVLVRRLVARLNASGKFTPVTRYTYTVMFDRFDANLLLVMALIGLQEAEGVCLEEME